MNKAMKLLIQGKVQGVGYRRWFAKQALELELKGYVQNLQTGEVEALVMGDEQIIQELLKRSWVGGRVGRKYPGLFKHQSSPMLILKNLKSCVK